MLVQETLDKYGQIGVEALQQVVPKATGKTAQSIHYQVFPNRLVIYARAFFSALETGRGPRKNSTYEGFDKNLLDWMTARGVGSGLNPKKKEQLARFLAYKINKEGDKTFKSGGKTVYSQVVEKFISELKNEILKVMAKQYTDKIVKELQDGVNSHKAA